MQDTVSQITRKQILAIADHLWDVRPANNPVKVREQWLRDVVAVSNALALDGDLKERFYKQAGAYEFYLSKDEIAAMKRDNTFKV